MSHRVSVTYPHVGFDEKGNPVLSGTTLKIVELVMAHRAHDWSPEELHFQHPELSLGQIHSALAYYRDHKDELNADIEQRSLDVEPGRDPKDCKDNRDKQKTRIVTILDVLVVPDVLASGFFCRAGTSVGGPQPRARRAADS